MEALQFTLEDGTPVKPHAGMQFRVPRRGSNPQLFTQQGEPVWLGDRPGLQIAHGGHPSALWVNQEFRSFFQTICLIVEWSTSLVIHDLDPTERWSEIYELREE